MVTLASHEDSLEIAKLLRDYSKTIDIGVAAEGFSLRKTSLLVSSCVNSGFAWVYREEGSNQILGTLIAQEQYNIFSDTVKEVHLLAVYVKPEHRNSTIGGRLLVTFDKKCEESETSVAWIGTQHTSELKDKSLLKLGYKLSEKNYLKEK